MSTSSYEKTKMNLEEEEKQNPLNFLSSTGTYRRNFIGQWVLEGNILNTATVASYKDVTFKIVYYSKTKTTLGTEEKTVFEYFKPNSTSAFKIKTTGFDGTSSIGFQIISAIAAE